MDHPRRSNQHHQQRKIKRTKRYTQYRLRKKAYQEKKMHEKDLETTVAGSDALAADPECAPQTNIPVSPGQAITKASLGSIETEPSSPGPSASPNTDNDLPKEGKKETTAKHIKSCIRVGYENHLLKRKVAALEKTVANLERDVEALKTSRDKNEQVGLSVVEQIADLNGAMSYLLGGSAHNGQYYYMRSGAWHTWKHDAWGGGPL